MKVNKQMLRSFYLFVMFKHFSLETLFNKGKFNHNKSKSTKSKSCKVITAVASVTLACHAYATTILVCMRINNIDCAAKQHSKRKLKKVIPKEQLKLFILFVVGLLFSFCFCL